MIVVSVYAVRSHRVTLPHLPMQADEQRGQQSCRPWSPRPLGAGARGPDRPLGEAGPEHRRRTRGTPASVSAHIPRGPGRLLSPVCPVLPTSGHLMPLLPRRQRA